LTSPTGTKESIGNESGGVGKYLKSTTSSSISKKRELDNEELDTEQIPEIKKKSKATGYNFGNFSSW